MDQEGKDLLRQILNELRLLNGRVSSSRQDEQSRAKQAEAMMKTMTSMMPPELRAAFEEAQKNGN